MRHESARTRVAWRIWATMGGLAFVASLVYGGMSYAGRFGVPIDWSAAGASTWPILVNAALMTAFACHHSIFAREGVKARVTAVLPPTLERSMYVWVASALFALMFALWRPVPGLLWRVTGPFATAGLALQWTGVVATALAARKLDVFQLSGIRQALDMPSAPPPALDSQGLYAFVRHPIYLAWFLMVWPSPVMTATRAEFALLSCGYLLAAIPIEERDLHRHFGAAYDRYCRTVRWRLLPFIY